MFICVWVFNISLALAFIYIPTIYCGWKHFPHHKGTLTGLILAGSAIGSFALISVSKQIVNPGGVQSNPINIDGFIFQKYPEEVTGNLTTMLIMVAAICMLLTFIAIRFINTPDQDILDMVTQESAEYLSPLLPQDTYPNECQDVSSGIEQSSFWVLFLCNTFSAGYGIFLTVMYKQLAAKYDQEHNKVEMLGTLVPVILGFGNFMWGTWQDLSDFQTLYRILLIIQVLCSAYLPYITTFNQFMLICLLSLACGAGHFSIFPITINKVFGLPQSHYIYACLFPSFGLAALGTIIAIFFFFPIYGFEGVLFGYTLASLVSFGLTMCFQEYIDWPKLWSRTASPISQMSMTPTKD